MFCSGCCNIQGTNSIININIYIKSRNVYLAQFIWFQLAVYVQWLVEHIMGDPDSVVEYI